MNRFLIMLSISVAAIELTSCHQEPEATSASATLSNDADSILEGRSFSYLALGDSYTVGESVSESDRWPFQLANQLATLLPLDTLLAPTILAATGWTTNNLSQALTSSGYEDETWDYVSLLIGVNNQYQGLALEQYEVEFSNLLNRAIGCAGGNPLRVFVVSIPDYGYTPFGQENQQTIQSELAAFNGACLSISADAGVAYFNITPISQQWPQTDNLIALDGLHPSAWHYTLWVQSFAQEVKEMLRP